MGVSISEDLSVNVSIKPLSHTFESKNKHILLMNCYGPDLVSTGRFGSGVCDWPLVVIWGMSTNLNFRIPLQ